MKYLKSYKIFESIATDTAKIKEALEIYAEDLPFELSDFDVASHIDSKDGKTIIYSVLCSYEFTGLELKNAHDTKYYVTRTEIEEQISKSFNKFAKKYDMECHNIMVDIELPDDAGDNTDINITFDLIQKLETFSNVTALEEALELYSEGLPFEMRNVYVSNKTQYDFDNEYDIYEVSYEHIEPSEAGNIDVKKHADAAFSKFAKRYDMEYGNPYKPWYNPSLHQLQYVERSINTTGATVDDAHDDDNNIVPYVTFTLKQIRGKKPYNKKFNESISDYDCKSIVDMLVLQLEDNGEFELDYSYGDRGIDVDWSMSPESYKWYIKNKESIPTEEYILQNSKSHIRSSTARSTNIPTSLLIYEDYSKNPEISKISELAIIAFEEDFDKGVESQNNIEVEVIDINTRIFDRLGKKFDIRFEVVGATYHKTHIIVEILMYDK